MNITPKELEAIRDNDPDFFDGNYTDDKKENFLYKAIALGKLDIIKHFVQQGVKIKNGNCICELVEKSNKVKILKYLEESGFDIAPNGGMPFLRACAANKADSADYLSHKIEYNSRAIAISLNVVVLRDKHKENKDSLNSFEKVLEIILKKSSGNTLNSILNIKTNNPKSDNNNLYVAGLFLNMDKPLLDKSEVLNNAIEKGKFNIIKLYMENGIKITKDTSLLELIKSPSIEIFEYLESKGVDLTTHNHSLLLQSIKDKNLVVAQFLLPKAENNKNVILNAAQLTIENFMPEDNPLLFKTLFKNISSSDLESISINIKDSVKKTSILNAYLSCHLDEKNKLKKLIKI